MPPIKSDNPSYQKRTRQDRQGIDPKEGSESPPLEEASFLSPSVSKDFFLWRLKFYAKYGAVARADKVFDEMRKAKVGSSNTNLFSAEELGELQSCLLSARRNGIQHYLQCLEEYAASGSVSFASGAIEKIKKYQSELLDEFLQRCCENSISSLKYHLQQIVEKQGVNKDDVAFADSLIEDIKFSYEKANIKLSEDDAQLLKDSYQNVRKRCIDNYLKISEEQVKDRDPRNLSSYLKEIKRLAEECGPEIADTLKERIERIENFIEHVPEEDFHRTMGERVDQSLDDFLESRGSDGGPAGSLNEVDFDKADSNGGSDLLELS
ncbi:MAG: hypothetical protein ACOX2O_04590 [Bdellovibrionota bacterium]|jgi:hypothetical protein